MTETETRRRSARSLARSAYPAAATWSAAFARSPGSMACRRTRSRWAREPKSASAAGTAMAAAPGTTGLTATAPAQDDAMPVFRVADADAALALRPRHGGTPAAQATGHPQWGTNPRTARLRDPDGRLIEL
ncbi:hypothetical protein ACFRMQ_18175, partial [Kitasatospora sp. NPDC056783]